VAYRIDRSGSVKSSRPTPQGGIRVDAHVRKVGILEYPQPNGSVRRELVCAEELSRADSIATLRAAVVTNRHPPGKVTPANYRKFAAGHVDGDARMDGDHLGCELVVQADDALTDIGRGVREVSAGYTCDLDETPGVWEGQAYDAIQRNINYNHVALVPQGRAGSSVRLRLDSNGDTFEETMSPEQIAKLQADLAAAQGQVTTLTAAVATEKTRADKAEGENAVNKARADALEAAEKTRADAAELAEVSAVAAKLVKGFKADGKTAAQIKAEVVAAKFPTLKLDAAHLEGAYLAASTANERADNSGALRAAAKAPETERTDAKVDPREAFKEKMRARGKAPIGVSKK
jgi:hypothetical protein